MTIPPHLEMIRRHYRGSRKANVEIKVGTIFRSDAACVRNMVVGQQSFGYVTPELETDFELEVSCANMSKKQPGKQNTVTVMPDLAPQGLIDLINLTEITFEPMRIQQFSIWTITDNPARDCYVGITASFAAEGSGPAYDELARIKELFLLAGIHVARYSALQRQSFLVFVGPLSMPLTLAEALFRGN